MPRAKPSRALARGVYRDGSSLLLQVTVGGQIVRERLPGDTLLATAIARRKLLVAAAHRDYPKPEKFTLSADIPTYLKLHKHQESYASKVAILRHWRERLGNWPRHQITRQDVLAARVAWLANKTSPKTVNHRVNVLRHLYRVLDGSQAPTPCDEVPPLPVQRTPIERIDDATILAVDANLQRREVHGSRTGRRFDGAKTRARFRVLVSTGRRPSELMRAKRSDVNLEQRVWVVRDGKGGWSPGIYLNADMLAAWKLFIAADAWGYYNTGSFAVTIRRAGWPEGVRPYQARHTTGIEAIERGADMADVQEALGHKSIATTRGYTGVRNSRSQRLSELLEGRFHGFPIVPADPPDPK